MGNITDGLGPVLDALAVIDAEVEIIDTHFHGAQLLYGGTSGTDTTFVRSTPVTVDFTGGDMVWGTEKQLTPGDLIGAGSALKTFDMDKMFVSDVSAANKPTVVQIYGFTVGAAVTCTFVGDDTDTVDKIGHGLVLHDRVVVDAPGNSTLVPSTVYYVIAGGLTADAFQLSTTQAGTKHEITTDAGAGSHYHKVTTADYILSSETIVSAASISLSDSFVQPINNIRLSCDHRLSIRSKSITGSTITIKAHFALHVYA